MRCSAYSIRDIRGFFVVKPDFVATVPQLNGVFISPPYCGRSEVSTN